MKYLFLITTIVLTACYGAADKYPTPKGYTACGNDGDCQAHQYCGFVGVDTRPVCKDTPHKYHWGF